MMYHLLVEAIDVGHGAASAGGGGLSIEPVERFVHQEDAWRAWAADELVRAQEDGVVAVDFAGFHVDLHVRTAA